MDASTWAFATNAYTGYHPVGESNAGRGLALYHSAGRPDIATGHVTELHSQLCVPHQLQRHADMVHSAIVISMGRRLVPRNR